MRVLLISANTERVNMPTLPLGLGLVAAATRRAGHEVALLDLMRQEAPLPALERELASVRPEVIGISIRNIDDQDSQAPRFLLEAVRPVLEACRRGSAAPVVLGGAGYSIFPDEVLAYLGADLGVAGDGERVFPELLEALARGADPAALPGVHRPGRRARRPPRSSSLDDLPAPEEALWTGLDAAAPDLWVPVQSRRGCPNDCSYCATARIQGRALRCRSPALVLAEIARVAGAGLLQLYFVDNSFNIPEAHALELCRGLEALGVGLRWRCILYPYRVSAELVKAMARAGCAEVALGFESGSPAVLGAMNKRFGPDDVRRAAELLAAHGIRRTGFLLLGGPEETRATVEESLAFADALELEALRVTVGLRIYPGTPLAARAAAEGVIAAGEPLLWPRFYLAPGLAPWIHARVTPGMRQR